MTMDVRCSADIKTEPGFAVVTLEMSSPADKPSPNLSDGIVVPPHLATNAGQSETIVWRFVVTGTDALPVGSATRFSTKAANAMDSEFEITPKGERPAEPHTAEVTGSSRVATAGR